MAVYVQLSNDRLTQKTWNQRLHEQTTNRLYFKKMIGDDKIGESNLDAIFSNYPIVKHTDLSKNAGDVITMGLIRQLNNTSTTQLSLTNIGRTGSETLVGNEQAKSFFQTQIKIAHLRNATADDAIMTTQRSLYDQARVSQSILSDEAARYMDESVVHAIYSGWSSNVIREYGIAEAPPAAHPNTMYGKGKTGFATIDVNDILDTDAIEIARTWADEQNMNQIIYNGKGEYVLLISFAGLYQLRADSRYNESVNNGAVRGDENPMFSARDGKWANVYIMPCNLITTAINYGGTTVAAGPPATLVQAAQTGFTLPVTADNVRMNILLGGNAVALAKGGHNISMGEEMYMAYRKEDDYGIIRGIAWGTVCGYRRSDYTVSTTGAPPIKNQGSMVLYSYTPPVTSNVGNIW